MAELDLLKKWLDEQTQLYNACNPNGLPRVRRLLTEAWLSDVGLDLQRLEKDVVQLESEKPSQVGLRHAFSRYFPLAAALSPIASGRKHTTESSGPMSDSVTPGLKSVANRLLIVFGFLSLQIAAAIVMLVLAFRLFAGFDPQTALTSEQRDARGPTRSQIHRLRNLLEGAQTRPSEPAKAQAVSVAAGDQPAPADAPVTCPAGCTPTSESGADVTALRGEVEGLAASLPELKLASSDVRTTNAWLDGVLADLDREPPDFRSAVAALTEVEQALAVDQGKLPPSLLELTILGSLLGMITVTTHLNWKFRNRWDTVGFIPWYATKLVAAPVISLCAVGFLSQVTFTKSLSAATTIADLGLLGGSPLLIFSVAILTGLFSNRVFDWLHSMANSATSTADAGSAKSKTDASSDDSPVGTS